MESTLLFRKRIIPDECIALKDDIILFNSNDLIVTKWQALKPKIDLHHGYSAYIVNEGIKISKFYNAKNELMYWYCDIVSHTYDKDKDTYVFTDLLADVIIYPDGKYKIVDLDEISEALQKNLITTDQACDSLNKLDTLLRKIYSGEFENYKEIFNKYTSED